MGLRSRLRHDVRNLRAACRLWCFNYMAILFDTVLVSNLHEYGKLCNVKP